MKAHPPPGKKLLRRQFGFWLVLLTGFGASAFLYQFIHDTETRRTMDEFSRRASVRHALISENIRGYEECLYNLRNLFTVSDDVTPAEFAATARDISTRHRGIQALQWAPVIPAARRAEVESLGRRQTSPSYTFTERDVNGTLIRAGERDVYYPILYSEPLHGNEAALGYDLSTGPSRADLDRAMRTRNLAMTRKIRLVQELPGINRYGVVMACPVFRTSDGNEQLFGFVQIVFRIDAMLGQSWITYPADGVDTLIIDRTQPDDPDPFLYSRNSAGAVASSPPLERIQDIPHDEVYTATMVIGGRTWSCYYTPSVDWLSRQASATPLLIALGSAVFTLVLSAYFLSMIRRSEIVEQEVQERTAELRHTQRQLETDIAKRQATEAELRESRRLLDSLLGQMPGMAYRYTHNDARTPTFISRGSVEVIGATPHELMSGMVNYTNLIPAEDRERHEATVAKALAKQEIYESEYRLRHCKTGRIKWVLDRGQGIFLNEGRLLFIEGLAIDITSRKEAEADRAALDRRLLESQKLESLGVLAGGIAHDFNNLLTTIVGHASIVRLELPAGSPLHYNLEQIESGSQRAGELCQQMLAYAGKGHFRVQRFSLEKLVRDTTPLLEHSISKRATLHFEFRLGVPEVDADLTQIRQIVMNLVVNASDSIADSDGCITVETCALRRNDPQLRNAVLVPPPGKGDFACLRVRDTGSGMTAETISKIFDPFFTTKFSGRGLGLAAVLGIVRGHHGGLIVTSTPGAGSTFTLLLPAANTVTPDQESRSPFGAGEKLSGTVLLIDDEAGVRDVSVQMFRSFGLQSLVAADGEEGLQLFKAHQESISFVLLDLTMPRMSGADTLHELRALAPQIPIILMSGYNQNAAPEFEGDARIGFLQKPFTLEALRKQIGKILA